MGRRINLAHNVVQNLWSCLQHQPCSHCLELDLATTDQTEKSCSNFFRTPWTCCMSPVQSWLHFFRNSHDLANWSIDFKLTFLWRKFRISCTWLIDSLTFSSEDYDDLLACQISIRTCSHAFKTLGWFILMRSFLLEDLHACMHAPNSFLSESHVWHGYGKWLLFKDGWVAKVCW
jgi:hypothetical protein